MKDILMLDTVTIINPSAKERWGPLTFAEIPTISNYQ